MVKKLLVCSLNVGTDSHCQVILRIKISLLRGIESLNWVHLANFLYLLFVKHHKVSFQGRGGMIYICKAQADLFLEFCSPRWFVFHLPRSFKLVFQVQRWELPVYNFWITLHSLLQDFQHFGYASISSNSLCLKE